MAAELDSLDGRKDPQRCTLLVSQFRSCQVSRGREGAGAAPAPLPRGDPVSRSPAGVAAPPVGQVCWPRTLSAFAWMKSCSAASFFLRRFSFSLFLLW